MSENILDIGPGRYEVALDLLIDRGGTSTVYVARQMTAGGRLVAFKIFDNAPRDPEALARFRARKAAEVAALGALNSPRIVAVIDSGVIESGPLAGLDYIVMEYVAGASLAARMDDLYERDEAFAPAEIARVLRETALALGDLAARHIVHRDVKPQNILFDDHDAVKLADFGLARIEGLTPGLTRHGVPVGTPAYMSPEQARGESCDVRSDLWSLGAVAYQMATGRPPGGPFPEDHDDLFEALAASAFVDDPPPRADRLVPEFPTALALVIERLLAHDPDVRYPNVGAFLDALASVERGLERAATTELEGFVASIPPEPQDLLAGRFEVLRELGAGASGRVLAAADRRLGRNVALKLLRSMSGEEERARFLREARLAASLPPHPHLVALFDADFLKADGREQPYLVMELVEGRTLAERTGVPVPWREALGYARQALEGLVVAHEAGLVHRDLKPSNLLIDGTGRVKVADFGIAKRAAPADATAKATLTQVGTVVGTPEYMSPEQMAGLPNLDGRSDLYAMGVVLYELISARMPYEGEGNMLALFFRTRNADTPPVELRSVAPDVPEDAAAFVHHLLEKDAANRPQSAGDAIAAIDALLARRRASPGKPWGIVAAVVAATLAMPVIAWRLSRDVERPSGPPTARTEASVESAPPPPPASPPAVVPEARAPETEREVRPAPAAPSLRELLATYAWSRDDLAALHAMTGAFTTHASALRLRSYGGLQQELQRIAAPGPLVRRFLDAAIEIVGLAHHAVKSTQREFQIGKHVDWARRGREPVVGRVEQLDDDVFVIDDGKSMQRVAIGEIAAEGLAKRFLPVVGIALAVLDGETAPIDKLDNPDQALLWLPVAIRVASDEARRLSGIGRHADARVMFESVASLEAKASLLTFARDEVRSCAREAEALRLFEEASWAELLDGHPRSIVAADAARRLRETVIGTGPDPSLDYDIFEGWTAVPALERGQTHRLDMVESRSVLKLADLEDTSRYARADLLPVGTSALAIVWRATWRDDASHVTVQLGGHAVRLGRERVSLVASQTGEERASAPLGAGKDGWHRLSVARAGRWLFAYVDDVLAFHVGLDAAELQGPLIVATRRAEFRVKSILVKPAGKP